MAKIKYKYNPETATWHWMIVGDDDVWLAESCIATSTKFGAWLAARRTLKHQNRKEWE